LPRLEFRNKQLATEIAVPAKQSSPHHWIFSKAQPVRDLHMAFYTCDYITKLCRQQAEVIQNYENANARTLDKTNRDAGNIRGLNLAAVNHTTVQVTRLLL
jgi:hypothetical protein